MRLIDADALKFDIMCVYGSNPQYINWLNHAPTVDAVPVRHGKWINRWSGCGSVWLEQSCSECALTFEDEPHEYKYCPNCGARMDEE